MNQPKFNLNLDLSKCRFEQVSLDEFPANEALESPPPTRALVESVKALGVVVPVAFWEKPDGKLEFVAGRRRIKAARQAMDEIIGAWHKANMEAGEVTTTAPAPHLEKISAIVYKADKKADVLRIVSLVENSFHEENPVHDSRAILELVKKGATQEQIALLTGKTKPQIEKLLSLAGLGDRALAAIEDGRLALGVARSLTKLPEKSRSELLAKVDEGIKGEDVKEVKRVKRTQAASSLSLPDMTLPKPDPLLAIEAALAPLGYRKTDGDKYDILVALVPDGPKHYYVKS